MFVEVKSVKVMTLLILICILMFICSTAIAWLHSWVDLDIEHFAEDFDILIELAGRLVDLKVDSFTVNCFVIFELPNFLHLSALTINYNKI